MFMKVEKKIEQIMEKKPSNIKTDNRIRRQIGLWLLVAEDEDKGLMNMKNVLLKIF